VLQLSSRSLTGSLPSSLGSASAALEVHAGPPQLPSLAALRHAPALPRGCFLPAVLCLLFLVPHLCNRAAVSSLLQFQADNGVPGTWTEGTLSGSTDLPGIQINTNSSITGIVITQAGNATGLPLNVSSLFPLASSLSVLVLSMTGFFGPVPLSSATSLPYETSTSSATNSQVLFPVS